jgi:tetratricopeptide (TPR) repeat protein
MKLFVALLLAVLAAGCATTPEAPTANRLFADHRFARPSERIDRADVFALSDEMRRYLAEDVARRARGMPDRQALMDALYAKGELQLEYESTRTRNAREAFADRAGNCLSLVIMTAAFAKAMDVPVRFQRGVIDETITRSGDLHFYVGHVNVSLGGRPVEQGLDRGRSDDMTVDFLPPRLARGMRTQPIREETVVAMYMNNRAAEALSRGRVEDAYWWARAAVGADPEFTSGYNTLGIVYQRHGDLAESEAVLAYALERDPRNTHVMSNLVGVLAARGRGDESAALARRLKELEPIPAFEYFDRGRKAYDAGNYAAARDLFAKEVDRAPRYHEFRYWLAAAYARMGDADAARREMALAVQYSSTYAERDLYAAKLDRLRSAAAH